MTLPARLARTLFGAALLCAAPCAATAQLATPHDGAAASTAPTSPAGPDVASGVRDDEPALARLRADLERALRATSTARAQRAVLVVSLDRGDTLFALNPHKLLAPASNLKLYTTAAALYYLGPDFRFSTFVLADGEVEGGVVQGDLVLYGTGDPTLSTRMLPQSVALLHALADTLRARGVREVQGDLVGDGTFFDAEQTAPGWTAEDLGAWYGAPVAALSFGENLVRRVPVRDPESHTMSAFRAALASRGIRVRGTTRLVRQPQASIFRAAATAPAPPSGAHVLAIYHSPTVAEIVSVTNHVSHNLFAEALLKTVGRVAVGEGSFAGGTRAVKSMLAREAGIDTAAIRLADGSGLSRENRVDAAATVALLSAMPHTDVWDAFHASLPTAGEEKGLRRMFGTPAAGRLRAKTGTLSHASSLAGYVQTANGERLAFTIMANDVPNVAAAKQLEDRIGARLAGFAR
jgi:D-alanyl-D-alanine carboxypeptidase/D-alanyl-D-alanine-endopeptidase (penicillin-binding protein 4)